MNRRAKDLSLLIAGVALGAGVFWFLSDRPADRKTRSAAFEEHADHVLAEDDEVTTEVPERLMDRAQKTQRRRTEASGTSAAEPAGKKPAPDATVERDEEEAPAQVPRNEKNAAMAEKMLAQASSELSLGTLSLETVWTGPLDRTTGRYPEVLYYLADIVWAKDSAPRANNVNVRFTERGIFPKVFGVGVGEELTITNEDTKFHNVHLFARVGEFNSAMPKQGQRVVKKMKAPGEAQVLRCDAHPSEAPAHAYAFAHPYYAMGDAEGSAEIANLPRGTYTLVATIGERETQRRVINFDGQGRHEVFSFSTEPVVPGTNTTPQQLSAR